MQLQELADDAQLNEELRHALTRNGELEVRLKSVRDELEEARQVRSRIWGGVRHCKHCCAVCDIFLIVVT